MERLQWSAFFKTQEPETYKEELLTLKRLKDSIDEKDADRSRELLEEFYNSSASIIESFQKFKNEGCNLSETFQYWDRFIALVAILRILVRADREGDWNLHLHTVQCILPCFALFDCVNKLLAMVSPIPGGYATFIRNGSLESIRHFFKVNLW